jgi:hypothetical protein
VNGLSARVDGSHAGRCYHDHALVGLQWQVLKKSGLSGASSSCEEDMRVGEEYQFFDEVKFLIDKSLLCHALNRVHCAKVVIIFHFYGGVWIFVVILQPESKPIADLQTNKSG